MLKLLHLQKDYFKKNLLSRVRDHATVKGSSFKYKVIHENPASLFAPVVALVSSMDDVREWAAALDLASSVVGMFEEDCAPAVLILSAENSIAAIDAEIVPLLAECRVGSLVTFGGWTAQALAPGYKAHNLQIPYVFSGLHSMAHLDLADEGPWRRFVTGIVSKHPEYHRVLSLLRFINPNFKRALVLHHPDHVQGRFQGVGAGITDSNLALCKEAGFEPVMLPVRSTEDIRDKLQQEFQKGDCVVLTGNDSVALSNLQAIVYMANAYQVPVVAQCLDAVAAGVAVGCGARGGHASRLIAERLRYIMEGGVKPGALSIDVIYESNRVRFNEETFHLQGLYPTFEQLVFLEAQAIHEPDQYPLPEKVRMHLERDHACC